ncbi:hypothetical protein ACFYU5_01320 [Nocardia aobensis]|jgi:hypothetical protein|uniref:Uncharacterized protein n=3 Tax=Nocardia TaxID=1817 RepID=A0A231H578_9NOCA|nr:MULTISPECIES: hypothetical protein [Nocardia]MBF5002301.1 hypothetical protein [Nocardia sp. BSTN01]MDR7169863.1 hypothetical protein [Nocardia kruczakiae]NKY46395.1 hypothetical protein [Nocardia cerradoensis]OXR43942.1 hypothetical protein B7C42_04181 [Nocardia cerradoensis]
MSQNRIRPRPTVPDIVALFHDDDQAGELFMRTDEVIAVPAGQFVAMARAVAQLADRALVGGGIHADRPDEGTLGAFGDAGENSVTEPEPVTRGLYVDADGDVWEHDELGWRLLLQAGVVVDPVSHWDWILGHVGEFGPFTFVAAS